MVSSAELLADPASRRDRNGPLQRSDPARSPWLDLPAAEQGIGRARGDVGEGRPNPDRGQYTGSGHVVLTTRQLGNPTVRADTGCRARPSPQPRRRRAGTASLPLPQPPGVCVDEVAVAVFVVVPVLTGGVVGDRGVTVTSVDVALDADDDGWAPTVDLILTHHCPCSLTTSTASLARVGETDCG